MLRFWEGFLCGLALVVLVLVLWPRDPCKNCPPAQCDDDCCKRHGCEVGRCLTESP